MTADRHRRAAAAGNGSQLPRPGRVCLWWWPDAAIGRHAPRESGWEVETARISAGFPQGDGLTGSGALCHHSPAREWRARNHARGTQ